MDMCIFRCFTVIPILDILYGCIPLWVSGALKWFQRCLNAIVTLLAQNVMGRGWSLLSQVQVVLIIVKYVMGRGILKNEFIWFNDWVWQDTHFKRKETMG